MKGDDAVDRFVDFAFGVFLLVAALTIAVCVYMAVTHQGGTEIRITTDTVQHDG